MNGGALRIAQDLRVAAQDCPAAVAQRLADAAEQLDQNLIAFGAIETSIMHAVATSGLPYDLCEHLHRLRAYVNDALQRVRSA